MIFPGSAVDLPLDIMEDGVQMFDPLRDEDAILSVDVFDRNRGHHPKECPLFGNSSFSFLQTFWLGCRRNRDTCLVKQKL